MSGERLALITNTDLGTIGGAQESQRQMINFANSWWTVISCHQLPEDISAEQLVVDTYGIPFSGHKLPKPREIENIVRCLDEVDPERIILNHPDFYSATIFAGLPQGLKDRSVAVWRGVVNSSPAISDGGIAKRAARSVLWSSLRRIQRVVGNRVQNNLAISKAVAQSLIDIGIDESKIQVIQDQLGDGYSPELRITYGEGLRNKYLDPDQLGVLVVSRISPEKGFDWIADFYSALKSERKFLHPDAFFRKVKLGIAGDAREGREDYRNEVVARLKRADMESSVSSISYEMFGFQTG